MNASKKKKKKRKHKELEDTAIDSPSIAEDDPSKRLKTIESLVQAPRAVSISTPTNSVPLNIGKRLASYNNMLTLARSGPLISQPQYAEQLKSPSVADPADMTPDTRIMSNKVVRVASELASYKKGAFDTLGMCPLSQLILFYRAKQRS